jgi:hypothetical protein
MVKMTNENDSTYRRNMSFLAPGMKNNNVITGGQAFKHYISRCIVVWMLKNGVPANLIDEAFFGIRITLDDLNCRVEASVKKFSCETDVPIVFQEAWFSEKLRADLFLPKTGDVIEIADSEEEKSLKLKERAYKNMDGLSFYALRV